MLSFQQKLKLDIIFVDPILVCVVWLVVGLELLRLCLNFELT
jgi:hypothetical protein